MFRHRYSRRFALCLVSRIPSWARDGPVEATGCVGYALLVCGPGLQADPLNIRCYAELGVLERIDCGGCAAYCIHSLAFTCTVFDLSQDLMYKGSRNSPEGWKERAHSLTSVSGIAAVNVASRMESLSVKGRVHCSAVSS